MSDAYKLSDFDLRQAAEAWREAADTSKRAGLPEVCLGTEVASLLADALEEAADECDRLRELLAGCLGYYDRAKDGAERLGGHMRVEVFEQAREALGEA